MQKLSGKIIDTCSVAEVEREVDEDQLLLPMFPDKEFIAQRDVVLSIKPQYSSLILEGRKTVELRRRFPGVPRGTLAFIYSTTPAQKMVGTAQIKKVLMKPIADIWSEFSQMACIDKVEFDNYFNGLNDGYVLQFENIRSLNRTVDLQELRERFNFEPPQSFLYANSDLSEALTNEWAKVSH